MPFEITLQGDFFLLRLFGVVNAADLDRLADEAILAEDSIPESLDRVTDLTSVERLDVEFSDICGLAGRRRTRRFSRPVKSAIVVRDLVQFGLSRMFQTLNDNPQIEIRILQSISEAQEWFADKPK